MTEHQQTLYENVLRSRLPWYEEHKLGVNVTIEFVSFGALLLTGGFVRSESGWQCVRIFPQPLSPHDQKELDSLFEHLQFGVHAH